MFGKIEIPTQPYRGAPEKAKRKAKAKANLEEGSSRAGLVIRTRSKRETPNVSL